MTETDRKIGRQTDRQIENDERGQKEGWFTHLRLSTQIENFPGKSDSSPHLQNCILDQRWGRGLMKKPCWIHLPISATLGSELQGVSMILLPTGSLTSDPGAVVTCSSCALKTDPQFCTSNAPSIQVHLVKSYTQCNPENSWLGRLWRFLDLYK